LLSEAEKLGDEHVTSATMKSFTLTDKHHSHYTALFFRNEAFIFAYNKTKNNTQCIVLSETTAILYTSSNIHIQPHTMIGKKY